MPPPPQKGQEFEFILDTKYAPFDIEYETSDDKMSIILKHIENVWGKYGEGEVYWSVITDGKYTNKNMSENKINEFYDSGNDTIKQIEMTLRRCGEWDKINRGLCMEYGCGVGRVTTHLSKIFDNVIGMDISKGHLKLAQKRIDEKNIQNITLKKVISLSDLDELPECDFIFTVIVLQHNPPPIIAKILKAFFKNIKKGGIVMFQVPVQMRGYNFSVDKYILDMKKNKMEMHMLQQNAILKIAQENNCYPLEIHDDDWIGEHYHYVSQTFVFKKR